MENIRLFDNLLLFADSGTLVNTTTGYVNAYTGSATTTTAMAPTMKTYYDTELLENARSKHIYRQLGKKQSLPKRHGRTVEWRKFNTFAKATTPLTEGVIPTGQQFGMTSLNATISQYGDYTAISDVLDMHAIDPIIMGATEEMGAAAGDTQDYLVRNALMTGTNVMYADTVNASTGAKTAVTARSGLAANNNRLTADTVNKAYTFLKKQKAPYFEGNKYVAVIHPSVTYDLRNDPAWLEAHKYSEATEIFNGEIGELHGVRFVENPDAPVITITPQSGSAYVCYATFFFGKDAFAVVDPEGVGMEMIIKSKDQVGGPLNQFSTVGYKFEDATKILYQNRMIRVESCSEFSTTDTAN